MSRDPLVIPENLRWLDAAARDVYEAAHRFQDSNPHVCLNVQWGHDRGGLGRRVDWPNILFVGWCYWAALALQTVQATKSQLREVAAWAREERRKLPLGEHETRFFQPFSALAEEAERLTRAAR